MLNTRLDKDECPTCHTVVDSAMSVAENARPSEGDVGICMYCGEAHIYGDGLRLRQPTDGEKREIMLDPTVLLAKVQLRGRPKQ